MKKLTLLLVAFSLFRASPVIAEEQIEPVTTEYLYGTCKEIGTKNGAIYEKTYCRAFIQGALNAHVHLTTSYNLPRQFCFPIANVENKLAEFFLKFVQENPKFIKKTAIHTLYYALHGAFPCPETQPSK